MPSCLEMDVRQLAALTAVADHGSFTAAAKALHTAQSNVSTHVAQRAREPHGTRCDRGTGRPTEEGEVGLARARRILAEVDAIGADVASIHDEIAGSARLGVIGTTARWLVPSLVDELH